MSYKLAFVGPKIIHDALVPMDSEWDFQHSITDIPSFINDLNSGQLSGETLLIVFFAGLFNDNRDEFAKTVAGMAPYAATCILSDPRKTDPAYNEAIKNAVLEEQDLLNKQDPRYQNGTPFYFIDYNDPRRGILESAASFSKSPVIEEVNRDAVGVLVPKVNAIEEIEFDETPMIDEYEGPVKLKSAPVGAKGKVIAVTSAKGGSGKSTVSLTLAAYIRKASLLSAKSGIEKDDLKVCIVDMDTRDGQLAFLTGAKKPPTIIDIFSQGDAEIESIKPNVWHSPTLECDFIFAAKRPRRARDIPARFYADLIQNLRAIYDIIILDTSVNYMDPLLGQVAYPLADRIVLVSDVSISSIFGMRRWILENCDAPELSPEERVDRSKVGIVINSVLKDVDMGPEKIEQAAAGVPILTMIPAVPSLITLAANTGTMERVLNIGAVNRPVKLLAESIITADQYNLADVPYATR